MFLLAVVTARAQGVAVSGNLKDTGVANVTGSNTYVRFTLEGYGANIPKVTGTNVIVVPYKDFHPDSNGNISGMIQGNDTISLGSNPPGGTDYQICTYYQGQQFICNTYTITGSTFNLNSAVPNTNNPTVPAPTGDTTYLRLDGGNSPVPGNFTFTGAPGIIESNAGVFTNVQMNEYMESRLNSCSPTTEFTTIQPAADFATEAITACLNIPGPSSVYQGDGIGAYVQNNSTATYGVAGYFQSRCIVTGSFCWGLNPVVADSAGQPSSNLQSIEADVNINNTTYSGLIAPSAYSVGGFWTAQPSAAVGYFLAQPVSTSMTYAYTEGIHISRNATRGTAIKLYGGCLSSTCNSQQLVFEGVSGGTGALVNQFANPSGDFVFQPVTGRNIIFQGNGGGNVGISLIEGTGTPAGAGTDECYADSATHNIKCSLNNGSFNSIGFEPTTYLKTGSGSGNYTGTGTGYANVDTTNLCQVVTIPAGWKLIVTASAVVGSATSAVAQSFSLSDIGATCGGAGVTPLTGSERAVTPAASGTFDATLATQAVINGDGAAHSISMQAKTSNAADAWGIQNTSTTAAPSMILQLVFSN
jgi:hypothetical protein